MVPLRLTERVSLQNSLHMPFLAELLYEIAWTRNLVWEMWSKITSGRWNLQRQSRKSVCIRVRCKTAKELHRESLLYCKAIPWPQEHPIRNRSILLLRPLRIQRRWLLPCRLLFKGKRFRPTEQSLVHYGVSTVSKKWLWKVPDWLLLQSVQDWEKVRDTRETSERSGS